VSVPILFREAEVVHNPFVGAFYSALVLAFCMLELPIYIYIDMVTVLAFCINSKRAQGGLNA
jgi:hypothetical protein